MLDTAQRRTDGQQPAAEQSSFASAGVRILDVSAHVSTNQPKLLLGTTNRTSFFLPSPGQNCVRILDVSAHVSTNQPKLLLGTTNRTSFFLPSPGQNCSVQRAGDEMTTGCVVG
jgi:hypothetical protein